MKKFMTILSVIGAVTLIASGCGNSTPEPPKDKDLPLPKSSQVD